MSGGYSCTKTARYAINRNFNQDLTAYLFNNLGDGQISELSWSGIQTFSKQLVRSKDIVATYYSRLFVGGPQLYFGVGIDVIANEPPEGRKISPRFGAEPELNIYRIPGKIIKATDSRLAVLFSKFSLDGAIAGHWPKDSWATLDEYIRLSIAPTKNTHEDRSG